MPDADPGLMTLFAEAIERPEPAERAAYLDAACGDDAALRQRVEALLVAHEGVGRFLEPNATGAFGPDLVATYQATDAGEDQGPPPSELAIGVHGSNGNAPTIAGIPTARGPVVFVPGRVIAGRYTLLEVLGEGGMGTVYRAKQSRPVKRQVALKLIKIGMDSRTVLARFDAERQALAMMDHPNIARVYDGGATDSNQPFFVMELVNGIPITDYCDRQRLSVDARLQLFVAVCQAVQHAHQRGIIHRDLKPSNVMVTEVDGRPTPKVIDFGVAKATESNLTDQSLGDTGAIVGTPTYMSPEQADPSSMDIDTRTDVYALGVILYELLSGSPPLDATQFQRGALIEMLRMVREVDPSKPSTKISTTNALPSIAANRGIDPAHLKRKLHGDLDWIVMKALEKDRTRRYETANGLGADILRHLASEPVQAAPPSRSYRLRKFARKHRAGVIAASLVVVALLAGIAGTTWGLFEARRQETLANDRAEGERLATRKALETAEQEKKARETAEAVLGFVEDKIIAAARPKNQDGGLGYDVKLADAIAAALPAIEKGFPSKPLTEAHLRTTIGLSFFDLGKPVIAAKQFEAAWSLSSRHLGPDHPDTLMSMGNLATSYADLGRHADAIKLREETLALMKAKLGPDHLNTLISMGNLASSYHDLGRHAEALKLREETLAPMKAKLGPDHPDTLASMGNLATSYADLGRHADALKLREETLALSKAKLGPDHPYTLMSMGNLALSYADLGRHAEALKLREETLALMKVRLGPDHPNTLIIMVNLASNYADLGRHADALKLREETLALMKARLGPDHPHMITSMNNLANSYHDLGRHADALKLREETLALSQAKLGPDHLDTLMSMGNLASSYADLGRHAEALKLREETLALSQDRLGPDHPQTLRCMHNLATSYDDLGRQAEALKLREETLALRKAKLGPDHPDTLASMGSLANSYTVLGRFDEALKLNEETLALMKAKLGPDHRDTLANMGNLANSYHDLDRLTDALKLREETLALMKAKLGPDHPHTLIIMGSLANSYDDLDRYAEALKLREETLALSQAKLGPDHPDTLSGMNNLTISYLAAGRTREALPLLEKYSAANPKDTARSLEVAALQAWFGQEKELAATRQRVLAYVKGTDDAMAAELAAKTCSILPSADKTQIDAAVVLARRAVDLGKDNEYLDSFLMTLGMLQYRSGHFAEAEVALTEAIDRGKGNPHVSDNMMKYYLAGTSGFYRAMSLFRQGKSDEARTIATEAAAKMKPLPADEQNPMADGAGFGDLILWLAYKEAKALIGFDAPPRRPGKTQREARKITTEDTEITERIGKEVFPGEEFDFHRGIGHGSGPAEILRELHVLRGSIS